MKSIVAFILIFLSFQSFSQEKATIKGVVKDEVDFTEVKQGMYALKLYSVSKNASITKKLIVR